ncbi:hypothetical protein KSP40_PGU016344 [Platanthera guangdongensis]|uniref:Uncharacterized protein n=1 Tax=Platanthera guangdongensis TaxID=2320717 RepID=A0ABR2MD13_9ASPA
MEHDDWVTDDLTVRLLPPLAPLQESDYGGIVEFNDIINISFPDYEIINSDAMLDMEERPILLPFLDECMEIMNSNGDIFVGKHKVRGRFMLARV